MLDSTCFADPETATDVRLSEEEVVALMINMIAFEGDWEAHLDFLEGLDGNHLWEYEQIPIVRALMRKDQEFNIQNGFCLDEQQP